MPYYGPIIVQYQQPGTNNWSLLQWCYLEFDNNGEAQSIQIADANPLGLMPYPDQFYTIAERKLDGQRLGTAQDATQEKYPLDLSHNIKLRVFDPSIDDEKNTEKMYCLGIHQLKCVVYIHGAATSNDQTCWDAKQPMAYIGAKPSAQFTMVRSCDRLRLSARDWDALNTAAMHAAQIAFRQQYLAWSKINSTSSDEVSVRAPDPAFRDCLQGEGDEINQSDAAEAALKLIAELDLIINTILDKTIKERATTVRQSLVDAFESEENPGDIAKYIALTHHLLIAKPGADRIQKIAEYRTHALQASGAPSVCWQAIGGVMLLLGACVVALGFCSIIPAMASIVGFAGLIIGVGLFAHGTRHTGTSKDMYNLASDLASASVVRDFERSSHERTTDAEASTEATI